MKHQKQHMVCLVWLDTAWWGIQSLLEVPSAGHWIKPSNPPGEVKGPSMETSMAQFKQRLSIMNHTWTIFDHEKLSFNVINHDLLAKSHWCVLTSCVYWLIHHVFWWVKLCIWLARQCRLRPYLHQRPLWFVETAAWFGICKALPWPLT